MTAWAQDALANTSGLELFVHISEWLRVIFIVYSALTLVALASYGASILGTGLLPRWAGWVSVGYALLGFSYLALLADLPPFANYLLFLLLGVLTLWSPRTSMSGWRTRSAISHVSDSKA
jgi:hypothetical protein